MRNLFFVLMCCTGLVCGQNYTDENGLKQGSWSKYYPWGSLRYEGTFEDDKEIGLFKFYDQNSKLVSQRNYETPGGTSQAIMFLPKGGVEAMGMFDGKKKIGEWKYFSTKGYLVSTENYIDGFKEGIEKVFYADSTLAESINWTKGLRNGVCLKYNSNGKLVQSVTYINDQLHGANTMNYPSGKKKITGTYKRGLKHGKWFYYSNSGVQEKMEVYEFGDLIKSVFREGDELKTIQHR